LGGSLASLQPLHWVQPVAGSVQERRFHDHLHRHHYLGMRVVGENLKYLVQTRDGADVACLLFGAAAWQARARDGYLGWNPAQRTQGLRYVANNTRFLVLPWVRVSGLASHLLSQAVRRLSSDWQLKHGKETQVLEILEALPAQRQADALVLSEVLQREVQYFQTPREHLHFQDLAAKGGPIGRGAVESTCGQLQTRVKRTGQFWKPAGLANMLALKAALQNEDWPSLWSLN
jgi:hypothetical protein